MVRVLRVRETRRVERVARWGPTSFGRQCCALVEEAREMARERQTMVTARMAAIVV